MAPRKARIVSQHTHTGYKYTHYFSSSNTRLIEFKNINNIDISLYVCQLEHA